MNRHELAPECLDDLEQIVANAVEFRGSAAAEDLREELFAAFQRPADLPGLVHRRPDLASRPRFFYLADLVLHRLSQGGRVAADPWHRPHIR